MVELELVELAIRGDRGAFGELVERYRNQVYGIAWHHVRDFETARDLAQETFLLAFAKLGKLREPATFAAWLRVLATNVCRMWLRRQRAETTSLEDGGCVTLLDPAPGPHTIAERTQLNHQVQAAILALPERQRLAVSLFYLGGLSYQQIAEFLGESVNAVESRLHRARACLRERMLDMVDDSLRSHELGKGFTSEVLNQLILVGLDYNSGEPSQPAITLRHEHRRLKPVLLSPRQAFAIGWKLNEGTSPRRPMTHELLQRILDAFEIRIEQVVLSKSAKDPMQAQIFLAHSGAEKSVHTNVGDALTIGLLVGASIYYQGKLPRLAKEHEPEPPVDAGEAKAPREHPSAESIAAEAARDAAMVKIDAQRKRSWKRTNWEDMPRTRVCNLEPFEERSAIVFLTDEKVVLRIYCSLPEAQVMASALRKAGTTTNLPELADDGNAKLTQKLIRDIMAAFDIEVRWIAVDRLADGVFFSVVAMQRGAVAEFVDARPSDAMGLALCCDRPLLVDPNILESQGTPKGDLPNGEFSPVQLESAGIFFRGLDKAIDHLKNHRGTVRLTAHEMENGALYVLALAADGMVLHEENGGSAQGCRRCLDDCKYWIEKKQVKQAKGTQCRVKVTQKFEPRWEVEWVLSGYREMPSAKRVHPSSEFLPRQSKSMSKFSRGLEQVTEYLKETRQDARVTVRALNTGEMRCIACTLDGSFLREETCGPVASCRKYFGHFEAWIKTKNELKFDDGTQCDLTPTRWTEPHSGVEWVLSNWRMASE